MSSVTIDMEIKSYIAALERYLDDLPEEDRRELLEDLEQHLNEVAAEGEGTLRERLGEPEAYAAELRATAGLPVRNASKRTRFVDAITRPLRHPALLPVRDFLPELRPGWWVLRGYIGVLALDALVGSHVRSGFMLLPNFGSSQLWGLCVIAVAIFVSVQLGRNARTPVFKWVSIAANVAGALTIFWMLSYPPVSDVEYVSEGPSFSPVLTHPDGSEISNICAYSSNLRPLKNVLLYDQNGKPIDNTAYVQYGGESVPGSELERGVSNLFPRRQQVIDPKTGRLRAFRCPTIDTDRGR
jgi:hypothetical protein